MNLRSRDWPTRAVLVLQRYKSAAGKVLTWARFVWLPLAVAFIAYVVLSSRDLLGTIVRDASLGGVVAAVAMWSFVHLNVPFFDLVVLKGLGHDVRYSTVLRIYLARLPTKYLPGGIWHNVTRLVALNQVQVRGSQLTALAALQIVLPACTAFAIGGTLVYLGIGSTTWKTIALILAAVGAVLLLAWRFALNRSVLRGRGHLTFWGYAGGIALATVTWVVAPLAFFFYLSAYPILPAEASLFAVAGAYLMSWGIGFVSVFTPQGLGVFEATAADMIVSITSYQTLLAIIVGFRLVVLISDVLAWVAFLVTQRLPGRQTGAHSRTSRA